MSVCVKSQLPVMSRSGGESYYPTVRLPIFDSVGVGFYAGVIGLCVKSDYSYCSLALGTAVGSGIRYIGRFPAMWNM